MQAHGTSMRTRELKHGKNVFTLWTSWCKKILASISCCFRWFHMQFAKLPANCNFDRIEFGQSILEVYIINLFIYFIY